MRLIRPEYRLDANLPPDPSATRRALSRIVVCLLLVAAALSMACDGAPVYLISWPITVVTTQPADGSRLPAPPPAVRVQVGKRLERQTVEASWVEVVVEGEPVAGSLVVDDLQPTELLFTPAQPLPFGVEVEVVVRAGLMQTYEVLPRVDLQVGFTIEAQRGTSVELGATQHVFVGDEALALAPVVRSASGELGVAFHTSSGPPLFGAAFWDVDGQQWSMASTTTAGATFAQDATVQCEGDGAGGLLVLADGRAVHHDRDASSEVAAVVGAQYLRRSAPAPAVAWGDGPLLAGQSFASYSWDTAARGWLPNLAAVEATEVRAVAAVVEAADRVQLVTASEQAGSAGAWSLEARSRDRFGVDGATSTLGDFAVGSRLVAQASAGDRSMLLVFEPSPDRDRLWALEFRGGEGWSRPQAIAELDREPVAVVADLAVGGAAVVVAEQRDATSSQLELLVRAPVGTWQRTQQLLPAASRMLAAGVDASGAAAVVVAFPDDVWVCCAAAGAPFLEALDMRQLAQLPTSIQGITAVAIEPVTSTAFLLLEALRVDGSGVLQSVVLQVQ